VLLQFLWKPHSAETHPILHTLHSTRAKKNRHQASLMHRNGTGGMQRSCSVQTNINFTNFIRISIQISTDASFQQLASASSCNQHLCRPQPVAVGGRYSISAHFRSLPRPSGFSHLWSSQRKHFQPIRQHIRSMLATPQLCLATSHVGHNHGPDFL
jgi:hypothetical protein